MSSTRKPPSSTNPSRLDINYLLNNSSNTHDLHNLHNYHNNSLSTSSSSTTSTSSSFSTPSPSPSPSPPHYLSSSYHPHSIITPTSSRSSSSSLSSSRSSRSTKPLVGKDRPFACEICQFPFAQRSDRNKHIRTVHYGERPFSCQYCNQRFGEKGNL